jgi:hypothetical protein
MVTRWTVELAAGGTLQVVRQNLDTTSADAESERGQQVTIGWRDDQTFAIAETNEGEAQ